MLQGISESKLALDSIPGHTPFKSGAAGRACNEAAFRHFLRIEQQRAARSGHCLLLVLVGVRARSGRHALLGAEAATAVFSALGESVREVDFVGWFREGRVAAAALVQRATPSVEVKQQVTGRIMTSLGKERFQRIGEPRVRVVTIWGRG